MTLHSAEEAREATLDSIYELNLELINTISSHVVEACKLGESLCFIPITKELEPSIGWSKFNQFFLHEEYGYDAVTVNRNTYESGWKSTTFYPPDPKELRISW